MNGPWWTFECARCQASVDGSHMECRGYAKCWKCGQLHVSRGSLYCGAPARINMKNIRTTATSVVFKVPV